MLALQIDRPGGPEVLVPKDLPTPEPGPGQIRVRHTAIGLNYVETYQRSGVYPLVLPKVLGQEAAGRVEAIGDGVTRFQIGDRAAYVSGSSGAYAECAVVGEGSAVKLPAFVTDDVAAAVMLKGLTVEMLIRRCYALEPGQTVLVHAAAGGVGQLLVQWAKAIGAAVIGTVGSEAKARIAYDHGADQVLLYTDPHWPEAVRAETGGVHVAYDGVGKTTFEGSIQCVKRRGWIIVYGAASGPAPLIDPMALTRAGSVFLTRPSLFDYVAETAELDAAATSLFAVLKAGAIKPQIGQRFALTDAADAHRALEGRQTVGSTLLIP